ncbi:MAG: copper transporter [Armatimonas sp.]
MMSPDFRYHVASLASVFLALGIGIAAGTWVVGSPFVERMEKRVQSQETQIKELDLRARGQEGNEEALKLLLPRLVNRQLAGLETLVIQLGDGVDDGAAADSAVEAIEKAGGSTHRVVLPDGAWGKLEDVDLGRQTRLLALALHGQTDASLRMSEDLVQGELPTTRVVRVVLAGGHEPLRRPRDLFLAQALNDDGCIVAAVERMETEAEAIMVYKRARVSFVDCIDRVVGQLALVRLLRGERGWFGLKMGADQVLPDSYSSKGGSETPTPDSTPEPLITPSPVPDPTPHP